MSDSDEYEWPSDNGSNEDNDEHVEIKNTFFVADDGKKNSPKEALEGFENVIMMSEDIDELSKMRFESYENVVCLSAQLGLYDKMVENQKKLLKMMDKVDRNVVDESINHILDAVSTISDADIQRWIYTITLDLLKTSNESLWFTMCLRLSKIYLDT